MAEAIIKNDVALPRACDAGKIAFVLDNVFSEEECKEWIAAAEANGFEEALVNTGDANVLMRDYRHSLRSIIDDHAMADKLFQRIRSFLPSSIEGWPLSCLNERLRFLRYEKGDFFAPHCDGVYTRPDVSERSFITVQLYLNEGAEGGATTFLDDDEQGGVMIVPVTGRVLIFEHRILHEGSLVTGGIKYAVRTDVMYKRP